MTRGNMLMGIGSMMAGVAGFALFLVIFWFGWIAWYLPIISGIAIVMGFVLFVTTPIKRARIRKGITPRREQIMTFNDEGIALTYKEFPKDGTEPTPVELGILPWGIIVGGAKTTRSAKIRYTAGQNAQTLIIPAENITDPGRLTDLMIEKIGKKFVVRN